MGVLQKQLKNAEGNLEEIIIRNCYCKVTKVI